MENLEAPTPKGSTQEKGEKSGKQGKRKRDTPRNGEWYPSRISSTISYKIRYLC